MHTQNMDARPEIPSTDDLIQVLEDVRLGYILSRFDLDSTYEWSSVLSIGEQQRLAFARLLLSKPNLALMDESTSALDEANEVLKWMPSSVSFRCSFLFVPFFCFIFMFIYLKNILAELLSLKYCEAVVIFFYSSLNIWNRITSLKIIIMGPHIISQLKELFIY